MGKIQLSLPAVRQVLLGGGRVVDREEEERLVARVEAACRHQDQAGTGTVSDREVRRRTDNLVNISHLSPGRW